MKQVVSTNVKIAQYVDIVDNTEWEYLKQEFPDAVFNEERKKYLSLEKDFFDRSDLAELLRKQTLYFSYHKKSKNKR
jgi:hypothetical protein